MELFEREVPNARRLDEEINPGTRIEIEGVDLPDGAEVMMNYKGRKIRCIAEREGDAVTLIVC